MGMWPVPNGVSAGSSLARPKFPWIFFRQLMALPKCTSTSIKIVLCIIRYVLYETAHSLRQSLPPMPKTVTLNTANTRLFTSMCFSLCTCLIVTSREFLAMEQCVWMWSLFEICILLRQWIKDTGNETENNVLRLDFHSSFHNVFLTIILLDYKVFEFAQRLFKNIPFPFYCPGKYRQYLPRTLYA